MRSMYVYISTKNSGWVGGWLCQAPLRQSGSVVVASKVNTALEYIVRSHHHHILPARLEINSSCGIHVCNQSTDWKNP